MASLLVHTIDPVFDERSRILILGSFPSEKSRESGFFYGHPQNRFWKVLSILFNEELPISIEEKKQFLLRRRIALWDVIGSCEIVGSSDASIKQVVPNDIRVILNAADIQTIYTVGKTALKYYNKHTLPITGREAIFLPSTSPANAAFGMEKLLEEWKKILDN
ncbi:MAG: DNA-deoxyinosine glycosylase [Clostridia bacterium]|nr:DNA-deoxyinosine glycosylase [Clostridia bacterium]